MGRESHNDELVYSGTFENNNAPSFVLVPEETPDQKWAAAKAKVGGGDQGGFSALGAEQIARAEDILSEAPALRLTTEADIAEAARITAEIQAKLKAIGSTRKA